MSSGVTLEISSGAWCKPIREHLSSHLLSSHNSDDTRLSNITFVCRHEEKVTWNGLAYLSSLSTLFRVRSGEEQHFTVFLPDYGAPLIRKFLLLLSTGVAFVRQFEVGELTGLAKDLGVS